MEFIDLKTQYEKINDLVQANTQRVYRHGQFILGPEVAEFEARLAHFVRTSHCVGVANGTDALVLALMAAGVGPGDEVIVPAFTFFATIESVLLVGAEPVMVDIEPKTYLISQEEIEASITAKTRAIIPVSLYGQCPDLPAIEALADKHGFVVIEDAAQSLGALHKGRRSGSFGHFGTTSFFPAKPLGAYGDGGAIFTSSDVMAHKLRELRQHGQAGRYHHTSVGLNSRLDTLQAAILLAKLEIFEKELVARQEVAARYTEALNGAVVTPTLATENTSAWAQYTIQVEDRERFCATLKDAGIPTAIHYPSTLAAQPAIRDRGILPRRPLVNAEAVAKRVVSLPMHPYLSKADQDRVIEAVLEAVSSTTSSSRSLNATLDRHPSP